MSTIRSLRGERLRRLSTGWRFTPMPSGSTGGGARSFSPMKLICLSRSASFQRLLIACRPSMKRRISKEHWNGLVQPTWINGRGGVRADGPGLTSGSRPGGAVWRHKKCELLLSCGVGVVAVDARRLRRVGDKLNGTWGNGRKVRGEPALRSNSHALDGLQDLPECLPWNLHAVRSRRMRRVSIVSRVAASRAGCRKMCWRGRSRASSLPIRSPPCRTSNRSSGLCSIVSMRSRSDQADQAIRRANGLRDESPAPCQLRKRRLSNPHW